MRYMITNTYFILFFLSFFRSSYQISKLELKNKFKNSPTSTNIYIMNHHQKLSFLIGVISIFLKLKGEGGVSLMISIKVERKIFFNSIKRLKFIALFEGIILCKLGLIKNSAWQNSYFCVCLLQSSDQQSLKNLQKKI